MPASELDRHREALVSREEALLRGERLPPNLNLQRRTDANVANPVASDPSIHDQSSGFVGRQAVLDKQSRTRPWADTLTASLERPGFRKPGFCGSDWDWRLLILIASRANHDGEVVIPTSRS